MNEKNDLQTKQQESDPTIKPRGQNNEPDEKFPGSFFRIPAPPVPGKTAWRKS